MSRNVARFKLKVVASPDYLARCGVPETPDDLVQTNVFTNALPPLARSDPGRLLVKNGRERSYSRRG